MRRRIYYWSWRRNFSTSTGGRGRCTTAASNSSTMICNSQRRQSAAAGEIYECSERRAAAEIYDGAAAGEIYECSERRAAAEIYDGGGQRRRGGITGEVLLQAATELLSGRRRRYMIVSPGLAPAEIYDCCGGVRGGGIIAAQMYYGGGLRRRYCEGDVLRRRPAFHCGGRRRWYIIAEVIAAGRGEGTVPSARKELKQRLVSRRK